MTRKLLLILLLNCLSLIGFGQKYFVKKINIANEFNDLKTTAITKDDKGFMYVGTHQGLYKHDGINFKHVDSFDKKISALYYQNGIVYIGCEDGCLAELFQGKIKIKKVKGLNSTTEISKIESSLNKSEIIISTKGQGLYVFNNDVAKTIDNKKGISDNFVYGFQQHNNTLWAATDRGLNKISNPTTKPSTEQFNTGNGLPDNIVSTINFSPNHSKICLGYQQGFVTLMDTNKLNLLGNIANENWKQINDVLYENDQQIWVATESGSLLILSYHNKQLKLKDSIMFDLPISKIEKDVAGNIWVLGLGGLFEIVAPNINTYQLDNSTFNLNELGAVANKFDTSIYYALQNKLYNYNLINKQNKLIYTSKHIITKLLKNNDELWIGTLNAGLWKMNTREKDIKKLSIDKLPENAHILDICNDQNNLWIASLEGLFQCKKDPRNTEQILSVEKYNKKDGLGSDYVYQIFLDSRKRVWFATDGAGPVFFENGKFHSWGNKIPQLKNKVIYSIDETANGIIWMTSFENGIYAFDGKNWTQYDKNYGLLKRDFLAIATQPNWHLIALQADAIYEYLPQQKFFRKYDKQTGINIDSLSSNINLIAKNEVGDILFPNRKGFIVFKSTSLEGNQISQVKITKVQAFLKDIEFGRSTFDNDENQISFEFEHSNFTNTEKLFFRYRLLGLSDQWISTNDKKITYSKLSPGKYTFEIQVSHNINFEGAQTDNYSFEVARAFYQKWWFYVALIMLTGYIVWLYIRSRETEIRKVESIQKERLHFEYEQLKSQVNPHFLFNSLNTLVDLIDENTDRAADYTIHLAAMYRTLLSFRDKELITIKEELDLLEHYIFVQKCRFGDALIIEIEIEEFRAQKKKIVPLALQLLVENAIKHNEVSRANPLLIKIYEDGYSLIVQNKLRSKLSEEKGEGFGISNLQKRYELLAQTEIIIEKENEHFVVKLPLL